MDFEKKVVLISGAASGVGRATSLRFAKEQASLILLDTNKQGLESLKMEVEALGAGAHIFDFDVTDESAYESLVSKISAKFDSLDILVNNAAVSAYGEFEKLPLSDFRKVIEVNFFGQVMLVRAFLPLLEKSFNGGKIIGVLSVLSEVPAPLQLAYVSSKFALKGFYEGLLEELAYKKSKVSIATILPSSLATPFFAHSKTFLGREPRAFPPVYSPELAAGAILQAARSPRLNIIVGGAGKFFILNYRLFPKLFHFFQSTLGNPIQISRKDKSPEARNLVDHASEEEGRIRGDQKFFIPSVLSVAFRPVVSLIALGSLLRRNR